VKSLRAAHRECYSVELLLPFPRKLIVYLQSNYERKSYNTCLV